MKKNVHGRAVRGSLESRFELCRRGNASAQCSLGEMYQYGLGISQDYVQAVYWYQRAANQDNTDAQTNLGYMYEYGLGVSKDAIKAVQLYRKAAKQGNTCAQFYFGCMYMLGRGVFKDNAQAAHWFRKAATQDHKFSQRCLGWLYMTGYGVIQDDAQAVQWYRKAAEQGEVGAQNNLGWMYLMGRGVLQDDVQAVYWYRKAAEQGDATAQYNLGWMYDNGRGISKDGVQAEQWYLQAAEQGMPSTQLAGKSFKWDPVVKAESILVASGASFSHDQSTEPLYRLMKDSIHLPPRENFEDPAAYYGTCLHELAHWAMHPSRLNLKRGIFPSKAFARAEICAELASWMIGQDAGIPHDPGRHAAYIQIWCKALRVDLYEIQPICRDAKQIKKYLLNLEHTKRIELNTIGTMPKREEDIAAVGILTDSTPENHFGIVLCRKKESLKKLGIKWSNGAKSLYVSIGTSLNRLQNWFSVVSQDFAQFFFQRFYNIHASTSRQHLTYMSIINEDNAGSALRIDEYDIPAYIRYSPEYKESIEFRESINNGEFNNIPAIFIKLRYEGVGELIYGRECLSIGKSKHLFIKK